MTTLIEILKNSFIVLKKEPKLFLPKIFLSLLWGTLLLYSVNLLVEIQKINSISSIEIQMNLLNELYSSILFLAVFSFVFFLLDTIINSAYPLMIQKYLKKESFSVFNSIKTVLQNFWKIILPVLIVFFVSLIVLIPFTVLLSFSFVQKDFILSGILALIVVVIVFAVTVLFYFIYPVAVIEKKGLISVINTIKKSKNNLKEASFGTFIALILSVFSAFLAAFSETPEVSIIALLIFFLLRIITAILATYSMVLNPLLYFKK